MPAANGPVEGESAVPLARGTSRKVSIGGVVQVPLSNSSKVTVPVGARLPGAPVTVAVSKAWDPAGLVSTQGAPSGKWSTVVTVVEAASATANGSHRLVEGA